MSTLSHLSTEGPHSPALSRTTNRMGQEITTTNMANIEPEAPLDLSRGHRPSHTSPHQAYVATRSQTTSVTNSLTFTIAPNHNNIRSAERDLFQLDYPTNKETSIRELITGTSQLNIAQPTVTESTADPAVASNQSPVPGELQIKQEPVDPLDLPATNQTCTPEPASPMATQSSARTPVKLEPLSSDSSLDTTAFWEGFHGAQARDQNSQQEAQLKEFYNIQECQVEIPPLTTEQIKRATKKPKPKPKKRFLPKRGIQKRRLSCRPICRSCE